MDLQQSDKAVSSWKEIANYFGVTIRTVQIWELERGLPIHRLPGGKGRVFAYVRELDAWANGESGRDPVEVEVERNASVAEPPWTRWLIAAVIVVALAAGGFAVSRFFSPEQRIPSTWVLRGRTLEVRNAKGVVAWRHEFPEVPVHVWEASDGVAAFPLTEPRVSDFDGDGKRETLFTYLGDSRVHPEPELYCFESNGSVRWKFKPGRTVMTRIDSFPPPFNIKVVLPVPPVAGKEPSLIVIGCHTVYYPSVVAALNPRGQVVHEYWHSGHIPHALIADLDDSGRQLLYLHAVHNASKSTELIVLDPGSFAGAARESNPDFQLLDMGQPVEVARIILPASDYARQRGEGPSPGGFRLVRGQLFVTATQDRIRELEADAPGVFYGFGPRLVLFRIAHTWNFKAYLSDRIRNGTLKPFDLDADLERMKKFEVVTPWLEASTGN